MRRLLASLTLAATALAAASTAVAEVTLDDIITGNIEARGGYDAWKAVESAHMQGTMMMGPGIEAPFEIWFKRPNRVRMEFEIQGMRGIQAFDGDKGWFVLPFMGKTEPEQMADDQLKDILETADFDGPLVDWESKGHKLELLGEEEIEGTPAYRVRLSKANGDQVDLYLDTEYFLEFKQTARTDRQGTEVVVHTTLGEYKEVDGLIMPHSMEMTFEGMPVAQAITIDTVDLNVAIDDDTFEMPVVEATAAE